MVLEIPSGVDHEQLDNAIIETLADEAAIGWELIDEDGIWLEEFDVEDDDFKGKTNMPVLLYPATSEEGAENEKHN